MHRESMKVDRNFTLGPSHQLTDLFHATVIFSEFLNVVYIFTSVAPLYSSTGLWLHSCSIDLNVNTCTKFHNFTPNSFGNICIFVRPHSLLINWLVIHQYFSIPTAKKLCEVRQNTNFCQNLLIFVGGVVAENTIHWSSGSWRQICSLWQLQTLFSSL